MQLRTFVAASILAAGMSFPLAGVALAQDRDCTDFATQPKAQAFFSQAGPGDPHLLDADKDGLACENLPGAPAGAREDSGGVPSGSIVTGAGGAAGDYALLLPLSLAGGAAATAAGVVLIRRRPNRRTE